MNKFVKLIISIVICQLAGIIGSIFTMGSVETWYVTIAKPAFNPPNWIFGPVWVTLYTLMGIAAFLIWKEDIKNKAVKNALTIFALQLIVNILWSIVFFGAHSIMGGLIIIIILFILIIVTIKSFYKVSKTAGNLLIPYLLWVGFATALNFAIWQLND